MLAEFWISRIQRAHQIIYQPDRLSHYERGDVSIRGNELQSSHWSRRCEPRCHSMTRIAKAQGRAVKRLPPIFLDLGNEVLDVGNTQTLQRRISFRVVSFRLRYEPLQVGCN